MDDTLGDRITNVEGEVTSLRSRAVVHPPTSLVNSSLLEEITWGGSGSRTEQLMKFQTNIDGTLELGFLVDLIAGALFKAPSFLVLDVTNNGGGAGTFTYFDTHTASIAAGITEQFGFECVMAAQWKEVLGIGSGSQQSYTLGDVFADCIPSMTLAVSSTTDMEIRIRFTPRYAYQLALYSYMPYPVDNPYPEFGLSNTTDFTDTDRPPE